MANAIKFVYVIFVSILYQSMRAMKHTHKHMHAKVSIGVGWLRGGGTMAEGGVLGMKQTEGAREKRQRGFVVMSR